MLHGDEVNPFHFIKIKMVQMFGWSREDASRASRSNRFKLLFCGESGGKTLMTMPGQLQHRWPYRLRPDAGSDLVSNSIIAQVCQSYERGQNFISIGVAVPIFRHYAPPHISERLLPQALWRRGERGSRVAITVSPAPVTS